MTTTTEVLEQTTSRQFTRLSLLGGTSELQGKVPAMRSFWSTTTLASLLLLAFSHEARADVMTFGSGANTSSMEFVTIRNPGNADDTTGNPNRAGSLAYKCPMGKYEVTEDMITKFSSSQFCVD
jgi:hypothetical protein